VCTIDMEDNGRAIDVLPGGRFFAYKIRFARGNAVDKLGACEPLALPCNQHVLYALGSVGEADSRSGFLRPDGGCLRFQAPQNLMVASGFKLPYGFLWQVTLDTCRAPVRVPAQLYKRLETPPRRFALTLWVGLCAVRQRGWNGDRGQCVHHQHDLLFERNLLGTRPLAAKEVGRSDNAELRDA
jgi:hypothetical protein